MIVDTADFENALFTDTTGAFEKIINEHGSDIYVIGLYHFGGWDGIMPLFNTKTDLAAVLEQECSGNDNNDIECKFSYKWNPASFPSLEQYSEYFDESEKQIRLLRGPITESSEDMQVRWQETLSAMERVMIKLDKAGIFSHGINRSAILLYIGTYDEKYALGFERMKRINPKNVIETIKEEIDFLVKREERWEKEAYDEAMKALGIVDDEK